MSLQALANPSEEIVLEKCVKVTWQYHIMGGNLKELFKNFRFMVNEGIRIGNEKNLTSRNALHHECYKDLRTEFHSKYVQTALGKSLAHLRLHRTIRKKRPYSKLPYVWKDSIEIDNQTYSIEDGFLIFPIKPDKPKMKIRLESYVLKQLEDMKLGSLQITPEKLIISYSKMIQQKIPKKWMGIDRNLNNVTTCDIDGKYTEHVLSKITKINKTYREVVSHFKRDDVRIRKKIYRKYGKKKRYRTIPLIHKNTKIIVMKGQGIVMEDLSGIRKLYRKGNDQGKKYRAIMNGWLFYEFARQIEYKAKWHGLPVVYVNARDTKPKCAECGVNLIPEDHRMMFCPHCKIHVDRDMNASKNILNRGLKFEPDGVTGEAMVGESTFEVISKVDVAQVPDDGSLKNGLMKNQSMQHDSDSVVKHESESAVRNNDSSERD